MLRELVYVWYVCHPFTMSLYDLTTLACAYHSHIMHAPSFNLDIIKQNDGKSGLILIKSQVWHSEMQTIANDNSCACSDALVPESAEDEEARHCQATARRRSIQC